MEGGVTGWGTDEDKVFQTLEGKSPAQIELIRKSYRDHYGKDLDRVVRSELSGAHLKHAEALLQGDASKSDAVAIQAELEGVFGSNDRILEKLEDKSPEERHAIAQKYAEANGGPGNKTPEDFLLQGLAKELDGTELERARSLLGASQATSPTEKEALELEALKAGLREDVDGMGTDEDRLFERLEQASPAQRQALLADPELMKALEDDLSTEDSARVRGLLEGTPGAAEAAQIRGAVNGTFGVDEEGVRAVLEGKSPEQLAAIKTQYQQQTGSSLEDEIRGWGGAEADVTLRLLTPPAEGDTKGQAEATAEKLHLAMDGAGTDEDAIRAALGGKSKAELDQVAVAYRERYGKDLRQELNSELDGRDELELLKQDYDRGAIDPNDPNASAERLRRLQEQRAAERGFGASALDGVQTLIKGEGESDLDRLDRNLDAADTAIRSGETDRAKTLTGYASDDVQSLQRSKDSLADGAATAAVVVVTTAAVVATGGAATPLAIGAYAALGASTRAGTYYALQGDAAGAQELWRQGAIGVVEGGTTVLPVTKGVSALGGGVKAATVQGAKEGATGGVRAATVQGVKEGAAGGMAGGVADSATRSETWKDGVWNGLGTVAQRAAIDGTVGALSGGLVSGGLTKVVERARPREIPIVRNPELTGNTTHVRYGDGQVRIEAGPRATDADIAAHLETARILQRYEGPLGQVRQLKDRVKQAIANTPGFGTQGFESRLEVQKLQSILGELEAAQAQLDRGIQGVTGRGGPATISENAALAREIAHVETQLHTHAARVDSLAPGRGVVAREGLPDAEARSHDIGLGLEALVERLRPPDGGSISAGGTFRITAPAVAGKRPLPEQSIELVLGPDDLYVRNLRIGDTDLPVRTNGDGRVEDDYPAGPRTILRSHEVDAVIRALHSHLRKGATDVSVQHPPPGLESLPDLIAMVSEGSRFPAIREQIRALDEGRVGNADFEEHALLEADGWAGPPVDPERTMPVHFIKNWRKRFVDGTATFGQPQWVDPVTGKPTLKTREPKGPRF